MKKQFYFQILLVILTLSIGLFSFKQVVEGWKKTFKSSSITISKVVPDTVRNDAVKYFVLRSRYLFENVDSNDAPSVVIVNGQPYFFNCDEGWKRELSQTILEEGNEEILTNFSIDKMKYMFLTDLETDKTLGLPSFINNNVTKTSDKLIFGPEGVEEMVIYINSAWSRNHEMIGEYNNESVVQGVAISNTSFYGNHKIFEDENVIIEAYPNDENYVSPSFTYQVKPKHNDLIFTIGKKVLD